MIKLAFRMLFKTPLVTTVAILSLALGIGANAAIFSLFDQLLLSPLPVSHPGELVNLSAPGPKPGSQSCNQAGECDDVFSYRMFRDLESGHTGLAGLAAHRSFGTNIVYHNSPLTSQGMFVSGSYFPVLGIHPALGRLLGPADDDNIGTHFVAVLSHDYWQSHLGSDPGVLDQQIVVNGRSITIVGVAQAGFQGTTVGTRPAIFVPITMSGLIQGYSRFEDRRNYWVYLFGRRRTGQSIEQARLAINSVYHPIITDVEAALQTRMSAPTLEKFKAKTVVVEAGQRGQSNIHRMARTPLLMLFGVTGIVLLIACANVANLLLARGANRAMEMGVRLALGATRRDLLTQLLTESVLLASMGGVASLLVAKATLGAVASLLPPEAATTLEFTLQPSVLVFAGVLSITTGLLFGLFPALHSTRADLVSTIRANAGQIAGAKAAARFRATLVTAQIALAMSLLIFAGLFMKSLVNVSRVDLGVRVDDVVTFGLSPARSGYDSTRSRQLYQRVEDELASTPGVTGVTDALVPLLAGNNWGNDVWVQGFPSGPDVDNNSNFNEVGPNYFATVGIPLVAGREFTTADGVGGPRVAVVNEAFTRKFNLGRDAVGKYMSSRGPDSLNIQIIGVSRDAKYSDVKRPVPPVFFLATRQDGDIGSTNFYVRTSLPPEQLLHTVALVMRRLDPMLPVEGLKTMPQQIRENVFLDRMISILSATFAVLATLLAGIGLYGVLAYTVAQRTREIGVRMALGADGARVRGMVLRQIGVMLAIGSLIGIAAALGLGKAASSLLFGLAGHDPVVFGVAVVLLALVALGAGYIPARRAAAVDPIQALRYE